MSQFSKGLPADGFYLLNMFLSITKYFSPENTVPLSLKDTLLIAAFFFFW